MSRFRRGSPAPLPPLGCLGTHDGSPPPPPLVGVRETSTCPPYSHLAVEPPDRNCSSLERSLGMAVPLGVGGTRVPGCERVGKISRSVVRSERAKPGRSSDFGPSGKRGRTRHVTSSYRLRGSPTADPRPCDSEHFDPSGGSWAIFVKPGGADAPQSPDGRAVGHPPPGVWQHGRRPAGRARRRARSRTRRRDIPWERRRAAARRGRRARPTTAGAPTPDRPRTQRQGPADVASAGPCRVLRRHRRGGATRTASPWARHPGRRPPGPGRGTPRWPRRGRRRSRSAPAGSGT